MAPPAAVAVPCGVSAVQRQWQPRGQTRFHHAPRLPSHGISGRGAAPPRPFKLNSQFGTPPPPLFTPPLQRSQRWPFARASTHLPAGSVGGPPRPTQQIAAPRPLPPPPWRCTAATRRSFARHSQSVRWWRGGVGGPPAGAPDPSPPPNWLDQRGGGGAPDRSAVAAPASGGTRQVAGAYPPRPSRSPPCAVQRVVVGAGDTTGRAGGSRACWPGGSPGGGEVGGERSPTQTHPPGM